ncbi:uncharacterized protein LOC110986575 [Acanthaster planci]|uniref:Uncharacterized protein LOC110986575 n=1 Tax=Acanthaster planci TaxID=133434 RepID=A0A8B7ZH80_ACAPL|nr:uncharacterized protein LOC110986575 [Acanthaster planci]
MNPIAALFAIFALMFTTTTAIPSCPQWFEKDEGLYGVCLSPQALSYDEGWSYCCGLHASLCSLAQLDELYQLGARDTHWGLINDESRDARLTSCGKYLHRPGECYDNNFPNTPRPAPRNEVYCCKMTK